MATGVVVCAVLLALACAPATSVPTTPLRQSSIARGGARAASLGRAGPLLHVLSDPKASLDQDHTDTTSASFMGYGDSLRKATRLVLRGGAPIVHWQGEVPGEQLNIVFVSAEVCLPASFVPPARHGSSVCWATNHRKYHGVPHEVPCQHPLAVIPSVFNDLHPFCVYRLDAASVLLMFLDKHEYDDLLLPSSSST
jgi:hypothetical protein